MEDDEAAGGGAIRTYQVKLHAYKIESETDSTIRDLWLSGIVVHGREYIYSQAGIESFRPKCTLLGEPTRVELLGSTEVPGALLLDFVIGLANSTRGRDAFCLGGGSDFNSFSAEVAAFLCGSELPEYLACGLPKDLTASENKLLAPLLAAESLADPETDASASVITFAKQKRRRGEPDPYLELAFQTTKTFKKEPSPELDELEAEIQALKLEQQKLQEKRAQLQLQHEEDEKALELLPIATPGPDKNIGAKCKKEKKDKKEKKRRKRDKKGSASDSNLLSRSEEESRKDGNNNNSNLKRSATTDGNEKGLIGKKKVSFFGIPEEESAATKENNKNDFKVITDSEIEYPLSLKEINSGDKSLGNIVDHSESALNERNRKLSEESQDDRIIVKEENIKDAENPVLVANGLLNGDVSADSCQEVATISADSVDDPAVISSDEEDKSELSEAAKRREEFSERIDQLINAMSEADENGATLAAEQAGEDGAAPAPKKRDQKPTEPPVTFREFEHVQDFEDLVRTIVTLVDPEDQDRLREMEDWIIKNEGTWVLSEGFNPFLGRVLHNKNLPSEGRVAMLRLLAYGAGQDDIVLIMHSDRKDHLIMNYAQQFDRLPIKEQEACALFFANLFENTSSSEWLMYISEWTTGGAELSNIRVTTKVAVNALLGDTPALRDYGTAIMHNLGTKEVKAVVFDDICTELAMAVLQFFQTDQLPEEQVFRCLKALDKFATIAHRDVPQLIKMIGPDPSVKFRGLSPRCDQLLESIGARVSAAPSF